MTATVKRIMTRYQKGYVTDAQLQRYLDLGVITQEEFDIIFETRHPKEEVVEEEIPVE